MINAPYRVCIVTGPCKSANPSTIPEHIRRFVREAQVAGLRSAGLHVVEPDGTDGEIQVFIPAIPESGAPLDPLGNAHPNRVLYKPS